jgi:hypothetical protein
MSIIEKRHGGNLIGDFFEHTKTGKKFRRIVGGFAWPGEKPGFVVAVGEELKQDPTTKKDICGWWERPRTSSLKISSEGQPNF